MRMLLATPATLRRRPQWRTTARTLLLGKTLSQQSRDRLTGWMTTSTRGLDRLRAGLSANWRVGTKAGTGPNGALNDVAIAWPPERAPILVASYMTGGISTTLRAALGRRTSRALSPPHGVDLMSLARCVPVMVLAVFAWNAGAQVDSPGIRRASAWIRR